MKNYKKTLLLSVIFLHLVGLGMLTWQWQTVNSQTKPLTYTEINTALNTKLPNSVFKNKTQLINWLITQIKQRQVDKPLTADREDLLREAGATDELIEVIRQNSPNQTNSSNSPSIENKTLLPASISIKIKQMAKTLLKYKYINRFTGKLAAVRANEDWSDNGVGLIDKTGSLVVQGKFYGVRNFNEGVAPVYIELRDEKNYSFRHGFVDENGKEITEIKYKDVRRFSEGLGPVKLLENGIWGFIDKQGFFIIPPRYSDARSFSDGLAPVELNGLWGYIDKTGKEIISAKYQGAGEFSEGLAFVMFNGGWGAIDKKGKNVIPFVYYGCNDSVVVPAFSEGLALVGFDDRGCGYINKLGKFVIPLKPKYLNMWDFKEGLARVQVGDYSNAKFGFINKMGKEVITVKYDYAEDFQDGLAIVKIGRDNDKYGVIDKTGKEVVLVKYDDIWCKGFVNEGFWGVTLNGKKGFVDIYGNEYFDF